jgi:hypothetical protein
VWGRSVASNEREREIEGDGGKEGGREGGRGAGGREGGREGEREKREGEKAVVCAGESLSGSQWGVGSRSGS